MKQLAVLVGCAISLLLLAGCQDGNEGNKAIDVIIKGGGKFPQFLVGRWRADNAGWEFVFEPGGTISSAVIDNGMLRVNPSERVATIPLKDGGVGIYELGQWTVQYSPESRELSVEIVVDHFHLDMLSYGLTGQTDDLFVGRVSEDLQTWTAEWSTFPEYIALTPEPSELPVDPNDNPIDTLVFRKQRETN